MTDKKKLNQESEITENNKSDLTQEKSAADKILERLKASNFKSNTESKDEVKDEKKTEETEKINQEVKTPDVEEVSTENIQIEEKTLDDTEVKEQKNLEIPKAEKVKEVIKDYSSLNREELLSEFASLIEAYPEKDIHSDIKKIKIVFDKETEKLKAAQLQKREEERKNAEEDDSEEIILTEPEKDLLLEKLDSLYKVWSEKRNEVKKKQQEQREKNSERKKGIIKDIEALINKPEAFGKTFQEFKAFQKLWDETGSVPKNQNQELWSEYNHAVERFYNYVKINKELRDLDLQKNTEIKEALCEEAEKLVEIEDITESHRKLQKLHDKWSETGPVYNEKKDVLWERFKEPTRIINDKYQIHFKSIKEQQEKNLESKTFLCEKAEEAAAQEYKSNSDWKKASSLVQKYQKLWSKIGYVPKQHNQSIYKRFSNACDKFFGKMRDYFEEINEEREDNLKKKQELLKLAEEKKESTDWSRDTKFFKRIQGEWKQIGPVPRKHSDKIWKQFRVACNLFFENKRSHFDKRKEEENENLRLKTELINEISEFKSEDKDTGIKKIKEFQLRWKEIGFVPIGDKDKIGDEYGAAVDKLFEQMGIDKSKEVSIKFSDKIQALENADEDRIWGEIGKLRSKIEEKTKEMNLWKNNLGFFANNKGSEKMREEFSKRIENAENEVKNLNEMIRKLENL